MHESSGSSGKLVGPLTAILGASLSCKAAGDISPASFESLSEFVCELLLGALLLDLMPLVLDAVVKHMVSGWPVRCSVL